MRPACGLPAGGGASCAGAAVAEGQQAALLSAVQAAVQQAAVDIRRGPRPRSVLLLLVPEQVDAAWPCCHPGHGLPGGGWHSL